MNREQKRKFSLRTSDKIILAVAVALAVITVALNVLLRFGIAPINGALRIYLPCLAALVLLGWGVYLLARVIKKVMLRRVVAVLLAIALFLAFTVVFSYAAFVANVAIPQRYRAIASPSGARKLVVLRSLDADENRVFARQTARLEADPQADPEITVDDWGYVYTAYPRVLGLFYRADADVEGEVYIGYAGEGTLMVEWLDDESAAHFFVQDPGVADGGECTVRFQ